MYGRKHYLGGSTTLLAALAAAFLLFMPTPSRAAAPRDTPDLTPTPPPTGCPTVTATGSGLCIPTMGYYYGFTVHNWGNVSSDGSFEVFLEVAQSSTGPWTVNRSSGVFNRTLQPGDNNISGNMGWFYIPPPDNYFRFRLDGTASDGCWTLDVTSPPTGICREATPAPTFTPSATSVPGTPTPTSTSSTPTPRNTPSITPTATATQCGPLGTWSTEASVPTLRGRALGVTLGSYIYLFGGRSEGTTYGQEIYRYDTAANSWITLTAALPDNQTSNMAGAVLNFPEGQRIFIAGGNGPGGTYTGRTLAFNPADGTFAAKAAWPASPVRIPGGWAVANNKFYVFGGIAVPTTGYADIWEYDPAANAWTQLPVSLSLARGYIATELMPDGIVYLAGGSQIDAGGSLTDEAIVEKFDPAAHTLTTGPSLPEPSSNNMGYNFSGKFVVPAGSILNITTDMMVLDLASQTWSFGPPALQAVRNYSKGYGPDGAIYLIGGIDQVGTAFYDVNQRLTPVVCTTPTVTATPSATPGSPTATPTECVMNFSDVQPSDYFYNDVHCVYCLGAVSGYADGTFRPFNNTTRGQMTKIIVIALQIPIVTPTGTPTFNDVPADNPFYAYVETAAANQIVSGYNCGGPGEPCPGLYFRPNANVTRGQLSKIAVVAANQVFGWNLENPANPTFIDVAPGSPFYTYIETAVCHGVISGYADRTFRPGLYAIRAQIAKIVCNTSQNPASTCPAPPTPTARPGTAGSN